MSWNPLDNNTAGDVGVVDSIGSCPAYAIMNDKIGIEYVANGNAEKAERADVAGRRGSRFNGIYKAGILFDGDYRVALYRGEKLLWPVNLLRREEEGIAACGVVDNLAKSPIRPLDVWTCEELIIVIALGPVKPRIKGDVG